MDTIRAGLHESVHGLIGKGHKSSDAVVSVKDITADNASDRTVSIKEESTTTMTKVRMNNTTTTTTTTTVRVTRLFDATKNIRGHICKLGDYSEHWFKVLDLESYLEYISDERLIHMPRRGSDWDRVLRTAQFFGYQLWSFGDRIGDFCPGTEDAAITALGSTQILLEVGSHLVATESQREKVPNTNIMTDWPWPSPSIGAHLPGSLRAHPPHLPRQPDL